MPFGCSRMLKCNIVILLGAILGSRQVGRFKGLSVVIQCIIVLGVRVIVKCVFGVLVRRDLDISSTSLLVVQMCLLLVFGCI